MPDDLTEALEEIQERAEKTRRAPALSKARDYACIRSAADVPVLLAALSAVLELHSRWEIREGDDGEGELERLVCRHCCAADGGGQTEDCAVTHMADECWPCDTYRAISRELTRKGGERWSLRPAP